MDRVLLNSPLNQAHSIGRAAEAYERYAKFEEARRCHQRAIEYLEDSAKLATFTSTQESIRLQIEFHAHQQEVISLKKLQYEVHQKVLAQKQKLMMMMLEQQSETKNTKREGEKLQWAIYKNIETAESLIDTLVAPKPEDESEEEVCSGTVYNNGVKHPKSESTVIEELHTLNSKLRELISQLLIQLEASQKEADALRAKVEYYESLPENKTEVKGTSEHNLIDFNSMSSSSESVGYMP